MFLLASRFFFDQVIIRLSFHLVSLVYDILRIVMGRFLKKNIDFKKINWIGVINVM